MKAGLALMLAALFLPEAARAAGLCITQGEALSCTDAGETIILKGGDGARYGRLAGERMLLTKDGQGNAYGLIGEQKLIIQRAEGMTIARFGNRKMVCLESNPGITICK